MSGRRSAICYITRIITWNGNGLLAFLNPYTEWTGYVANAGFALAELIINWKRSRKKGFGKAVTIGVISVASFGVFSMHYLLRTSASTFFHALRERLMVRTVTINILVIEVVKGYLDSFLYIWLLLLILAVWNLVKNKKIEIHEGILCLIMSFPLLENIIMKQHAVEYTYDRMKAAWIVVFIICELIRNLLDVSDKKKTVYI